jgi:hypothetical protein
MSALLDIAPCGLSEVVRLFRGAYCLHYQGNESCAYNILKSTETWINSILCHAYVKLMSVVFGSMTLYVCVCVYARALVLSHAQTL